MAAEAEVKPEVGSETAVYMISTDVLCMISGILFFEYRPFCEIDFKMILRSWGHVV